MPSIARLAIVALALPIAAGRSSTAERSVTLVVERMACPICAHTVQRSLKRVSGVTKVSVNLKDKTAVIIYEDTKTDVIDLISASTNVGFPAAIKR
jgi:mercuric transport protein